jgi:Glycosyltransferase family 87
MGKRALRWVPVALGLFCLLSLVYLQRGRALAGQNDFAALYAGARLAGTPDLYSRPANQALVRSILGVHLEHVVYTRPPFYAALLKPLSLLPYSSAYALFSLASLSSLVWFVWRFSREAPELPVFAAMNLPAIVALYEGQDTPLLVALMGGFILLTRRNRDVAAGVLLSLCAIKFHLFLLVPLLLLLKRRWRVLTGVALGTAILTLLALLVAGPASFLAYWETLHSNVANPYASMMPNLHGLVTVLRAGPWVEVAISFLVIAAFAGIALQADNFELLLAAVIAFSLQISFHSEVMDDVLLLPVFAGVIANSASPSLRTSMALILTPFPYFCALAGAPYSALFPAALFLVLGTFVAAIVPRRNSIALNQEIPAN